MFDVFYIGKPPNLFAFERAVNNIQEAADLSRTRFFWLVHGDNDYSNFNFEWRCMPYDEQYVHVFPSQWQRNGGTYFACKKYAYELKFKFHTAPLVPRLSNLNNWEIPFKIKKNKFDFSWHPDPVEENYSRYFPSQWQRSGGPIYKGNSGIKFENCQIAETVADIDNWIVPFEIDTAKFDFSWHPDILEPDYEYHFPTQWQPTGGPIFKGTSGIKLSTAQQAVNQVPEIFYMDFLNIESKENLEKIKTKWSNVKIVRYVDNHLNVFKRIANLAKHKQVWIISSICNYDNFDFTWHPNIFQQHMIHVFSGKDLVDLRGDTFYIDIESFSKQMYDLEILDWFHIINYCQDQQVTRLPCPVNYYEDSANLIEVIKNYEFTFPYAFFSNQKNSLPDFKVPCLWSEKDRTLDKLTRSGAMCMVPRDTKIYLKEQLYDYPHIKKNCISYDYFGDNGLSQLDIVYISNGEPNENQFYEWLQKHTFTKVHWIRGIDNRTKAIKEAANTVKTPWFYCVPAKLMIKQDFDWTWMPDFFQKPKHYIFHATNVVNDLEYGHMGMIAYNKKLVLETDNPGLDFTMSKPHEVVPVLSGIAYFNQDPKTTWRTAFREVLKLKYYQTTTPTVETEYRLKIWSTKAKGSFADWALQGASDALEYYTLVKGEYAKLELSYAWQWLDEYIKNKGYNI